MQGTIRLFKFSGIQVYLHFSWFIVAAYQLTQRLNNYHAPIFAVYEYLALFGIVLLHEFGHALACRQTGGTADHIELPALTSEGLNTANGLESIVPKFETRDATRLKGTLKTGQGNCPGPNGTQVYCKPTGDFAFDAPVVQ